ncbi:MAG: hypothetical protein WED10_00190 [Brumimicrobium sp.]
MRKWLKISLWIVFLIGVIVLSISAAKVEQSKPLDQPEISLEVQNGVALLTEEELLRALQMEQLVKDEMIKSDIDIKGMESFLESLNEIETADVFMELGSKWHIKVKTRLPIARIVMNNGDGFYIDNRSKVMSISPYAKPKILAFTGMEAVFGQGVNLNEIINNDSLKTILKLDQIYRISNYVCNSAFYDAQIVQVHYDKEEGFILVPRVGKHEVIFGSAASKEQVENKFEKLTTFYEEVIPFEGWNKYKSINLKFENQIVAKKN